MLHQTYTQEGEQMIVCHRNDPLQAFSIETIVPLRQQDGNTERSKQTKSHALIGRAIGVDLVFSALN